MLQILVPGFSFPHTDTEHKQYVGVDALPVLLECPKKIEYGKLFLPIGQMVLSEM